MKRHEAKVRPVHLLVAALLLLTGGAQVLAEPLPLLDYRSESWFLPQTPAVTGGPAATFFNPAAWAMNDRGATDFWWNDRSVRPGLDNYGLAFGHELGFAMNTTTFGNRDQSWKVYEYQLGLAGGNRLGSFGLSYRWAHGETGLREGARQSGDDQRLADVGAGALDHERRRHGPASRSIICAYDPMTRPRLRPIGPTLSPRQSAASNNGSPSPCQSRRE